MPSLLLSLPFRWLHYGDVAKTAAHDFCREVFGACDGRPTSPTFAVGDPEPRAPGPIVIGRRAAGCVYCGRGGRGSKTRQYCALYSGYCTRRR